MVKLQRSATVNGNEIAVHDVRCMNGAVRKWLIKVNFIFDFDFKFQVRTTNINENLM